MSALQTVALARHAMATRFEILLHGHDPVALRAAGEEALDEIERLEAQLSLYRPTSEIAHLNARAANGPVRVSPDLFRLLQHAQRLYEETAGAFDITIAPLMRCWGFMGDNGRLPDADELAEARARTGMGLVELRSADFTVRYAHAGVMLDLGAIGKGHAIERTAADSARGWRQQCPIARRHQHRPCDRLSSRRRHLERGHRIRTKPEKLPTRPGTAASPRRTAGWRKAGPEGGPCG